MEKLKIKINPIYLIFIFFCVYSGYLKEIVTYSLLLIMHEYSHILTGKILGYGFKEIKLSFYGASVYTKSRFKAKDEILISLAGPLLNIILAILILAIWWLFPTLYESTIIVFEANISIAFFNLIPIFPLDAGRALYAFTKNKFKRKKINNILKINVLIFIIIFSILTIMSAFKSFNLNFLFIDCFLIMSLFNNINYSTLDFVEKNNKDFLEVKTFITTQCNYRLLARRLSPEYYSQFYIINEMGLITKKITEKDILKCLYNIN